MRCWRLLICLLALWISVPTLGGEIDQRLAIPDAKSQATAEASIKDVYKADFAKRAPSERLALASKLIGLAAEGKSDPAERYVLLHDAADLAVQAGDVATTTRALDALSDDFSVKGAELRLAALSRIAPNVKTPASNRDLVDAALQVCDAAGGEQHFEDASKAATLASSAAEKTRDKDLIASVKLRATSVEHARDQYVRSEQALKVLQKAPGDEAANTIVGRYLCFARADWERGLPYLTHDSDELLHSLATRDLALPTQAAQMQMLGNDWWMWADKAERAEAAPARSRAAFWYEKALPDMKGLEKTLDEKRIEQAAAGAAPAQRVINLMPLIDLKRDAVAGEWTMRGRTLVTTAGQPFSRLSIGYKPPAEYDFRITFVRVSGNDAVVQMLLHDDRPFIWIIGAWTNTVAGFQLIDGKGAADSPAGIRSEAWLRQGVKTTSVVRVRRKSVAAYLDGKLVSNHPTNYSDLSASDVWNDGCILGVGSWSSAVEFTAIELTEITGRGKPIIATHDAHPTGKSP